MRLLKSIIAGAGLLFVTTQAQSAIVSSSVVAEDNPGAYSITLNSNQVIYAWDNPNDPDFPNDGSAYPGSAFVEFVVGVDSILSLESYISGSTTASRMQLRDSSGNALALATTPAGSSTQPPNQLNNLAGLVGSPVPGGDSGSGLEFSPGTSGELFASLAAGATYYLGFQENGDPAAGTVTFSITAVPVPAAGLLFGSALMGAAALRRRKAAQVAA